MNRRLSGMDFRYLSKLMGNDRVSNFTFALKQKKNKRRFAMFQNTKGKLAAQRTNHVIGWAHRSKLMIRQS